MLWGLSLTGPPVKRQKPSTNTACIDDDELVELAQLQWTQSQKPLQPSFARAPHTAAGNHPADAGAVKHSNDDTTAAMDEERELAELVCLANSRLASSSLAAAQQLPDIPSTSANLMEDEQHDPAADCTTSAAPSWSGAEISGESLSVTVGDGRRAYCRLNNSFGRPQTRRSRPGQLLSVPISSLLQKAEQESFDRAVADSKKFTDFSKALVEGQLDDDEMLPPASSSSQQTGQKHLWVDKYSPKSFFELLSDEKVNIEVIKWVKSWDGSAHRKTMKQQQKGPEQKLLMLCGAPGMLNTCLILDCLFMLQFCFLQTQALQQTSKHMQQ